MTAGEKPTRAGYRSSLRSTARASAIPYGYTITIWSSGTVSTDVLGGPHLSQVLLFLAGAVAAFLVVEGAAFGSIRLIGPAPPPPAVALWGQAHWGAAGVAVVLVWTGDHLIGGTSAWPVAGFLATSVYLLLAALQATLAARNGDDGAGGARP